MFKQEESFDFKVLEKLNLSKQEIEKKEDALTIVLETVLPQISGIAMTCFMIIVLLKILNIPETSLLHISHPEFSPLFVLIAKANFIGKSINQILYYLKNKNLKGQFISGFINIGLFYLIFQNGGFQNMFKFIVELLSKIF